MVECSPEDCPIIVSRHNDPIFRLNRCEISWRRLLTTVVTAAAVAGVVLFRSPTEDTGVGHHFFRHTSGSTEGTSTSVARSMNYQYPRTKEQTAMDVFGQEGSANMSPATYGHRRIQEGLQGTVAVPEYVGIILVVLMTLISAVFSGLTLGLLSLDKTQLEILMNNTDADPAAAARAKRIYPVRANGNILLCSLMWGNVGANVLQSILMAGLADPVAGFLISTFLLVVFTEILPLAICSRHALVIGSFAAPFVQVLIYILFPIVYPLAWILDKMLGRELGMTYTKAEFEQLLEIHAQRGGFNKEMASAMTGALKYQDVKVSDVMTPMDQVYMLSVDEKLSYENILSIFKTGYSRIPVYEGKNRNDVSGLLLTKDLIFVDPADDISVEAFVRIFGRGLHVVWPNDSLGDVLRELKQGRSHMALVRDVNKDDGAHGPFYEIKGIITLENIIEVILGDEIYDETDAVDDQTQRNRMDRIESDWATLKLRDTKQVDMTLSLSERKAVVAYLRAHYNDLLSQLTDRILEEMVASTPVTEIDGSNDESELSNMIYQKGVPSDVCTLILSGKVTVLVGKDEFQSELGPWSVLATQALTDAEFVPDFSAVSLGSCRCLRFSRDMFVVAIRAASADVETGGPNGAFQAEITSEPKAEMNGSLSMKDRTHLRTELLAVFNHTITAPKLDKALKSSGAYQATSSNDSPEPAASSPSGVS